MIVPMVAAGLAAISVPAGSVDHSSARPVDMQAPSYLFVWAADADGGESDFLAVIDGTRGSSSYGSVVATLPVGVRRTEAHHTEPEMPSGGILLANGFNAGITFRFDLRNPLTPRLMSPLPVPPPYQHAHSFARLADGRVLATYQYQGGDHSLPGGIVEYDSAGTILRVASAVDAASAEFVRPYSIAVSPRLDRAVTSGHDMHKAQVSRAVQIWRISSLSLLSTVVLPAGPRGNENVHSYEPRFLKDGKTAMVSSRSCGLYRLKRLGGGRPSASLVFTFDDTRCFVPVVIGRYWLQALGNKPEIVVLDVADSRKPREVFRLRLRKGDTPHWLAASSDGKRIVITGYNGLERRLLVADFDQSTGALYIDKTFGEGGSSGITFDRAEWPHGATGPAIPHGSVFSRTVGQGDVGRPKISGD